MVTPTWPQQTDLIGLRFELIPHHTSIIQPRYQASLHAWFLHQVQYLDPAFSAHLHDNQDEKAFTLSGLHGSFSPRGRHLELIANQPYQWQITALEKNLIQWLGHWLKQLPPTLDVAQGDERISLRIESVQIALPATRYSTLLQLNTPAKPILPLHFASPTSFRRKKEHMPLPWPPTVFHSYLRRWNQFAPDPVDQELFLDWVDEYVTVLDHQIQTRMIQAGKQGSVRGFTGNVRFGLSPKGREHEAFSHLFWVLGHFAPYCGTGHKTTFGLGQTVWGWPDLDAVDPSTPVAQTEVTVHELLARRIDELTDLYRGLRKRKGGKRADQIAVRRATILARREFGESLQQIAEDLQMPYATVKTYAKLARRELREARSSAPSESKEDWDP